MPPNLSLLSSRSSLQPKKSKGLTKISHRILSVISHQQNATTGEVVLQAKKENIADFVAKAELLNLENAGFITRNVSDRDDPLNNSSWKVTTEGSEALNQGPLSLPRLGTQVSDEVPDIEDTSGVQVVMTCPADFKQQFANLETQESVDILKRLFIATSTEMR